MFVAVSESGSPNQVREPSYDCAWTQYRLRWHPYAWSANLLMKLLSDTVRDIF